MKNPKGSATVWVVIILVLVIIAGVAYWYLSQNSTQPATSATTETPVSQNTNTIAPVQQPAQTTTNAPSQTTTQPLTMTIDQNSLNTTSLTPTITGHASGVTAINVEVEDYAGARMAQNNAAFNSSTGAWSFPINSSTETENTSGGLSLNAPGKYSVFVIGLDEAGNTLKVATGTLTITQ